MNYLYQKSKENFLKITICDENKAVFNSIIRKIKQIPNIDILDIEHMSRKNISQGSENVELNYFYTEVSAQNVDKWEAIKYILERENIKAEEVIAIGDNINDKEMLQNSGLGIAMKGSAPSVIEVANMVTEETNDLDGVEKVLRRLILSD